MKLSQATAFLILITLTLSPLILVPQVALAEESASGDAITFTSREETWVPYKLIILMTASALFGITYQRVPCVRFATGEICKLAHRTIVMCWTFLMGKRPLTS